MSEQRLIDANQMEEHVMQSKVFTPYFKELVQSLIWGENTVKAAPVVHCGECIWWQGRQVQLADGSCRDYLPNEPWSVTSDVGINVGSHCTKHGFEDKSGSWFWANAEDFCSRGAKMCKEDKP